MSFGMDYQGDMGSGGNTYGGGYDSNAGGFGGGGGGGGTPRARKSYDEQTLVPVTAQMILQATSNGDALTLQDGRELYHVKYIGAVRTFEDASTNATFAIEDGTGLIDVKQWSDANTDCPVVVEMRKACMQDHVYVKVIGQVKDYDGKKTLVAHTVRRLETMNEFTYHMLEVVYSAEKYQRKDSFVPGGVPTGGVGFGAGVGGGAPVAQATNGAGNGNDVRDAVLNYIRNEGQNGQFGAEVPRCIQVLTANGRFTEADIRGAIESLSGEGHIYSTIDEDHYSFAM